MKILANITAYNESIFLDYVLNSIHPYVDYICIIDGAMENVVKNGGQPHSTDESVEIIKHWVQKSDKIYHIKPPTPPKNFVELGTYGLDLAKELKCDWFFSVGADEIWDKISITPLRNFLNRCEKSNIMGVNVHMHAFCPDFFHRYDFYVPRIGRITDDACMPFKSCDVLYWPKLNAWQSIELDKVPPHVKALNIDYHKFLKVFHYSCVGYDRIKFKYNFYKTYTDNVGSEHYAHFMNKDWDYFKNVLKCVEFKGKHPDIMLKHPSYHERMY